MASDLNIIVMLLYVLLVVGQSALADDCNWALRYCDDLSRLFVNSDLQDEAMLLASQAAGRLAVDGVGLHFNHGITREGVVIDPDTGQPRVARPVS